MQFPNRTVLPKTENRKLKTVLISGLPGFSLFSRSVIMPGQEAFRQDLADVVILHEHIHLAHVGHEAAQEVQPLFVFRRRAFAETGPDHVLEDLQLKSVRARATAGCERALSIWAAIPCVPKWSDSI